MKKILKRLELPMSLLEDDYPQRFAAAQTRNTALLAALRQLEKEDPEFWCNLPWSEDRARWEAEEGWKNEPCTDPRMVMDWLWKPKSDAFMSFFKREKRNELPWYLADKAACCARRKERLKKRQTAELLDQACRDVAKGIDTSED